MKKLLTISIPTWNRATLLHELLEELTFQIQHYSLTDYIQVLISDNASEDNTWNVINDYKSRFQFISSNRNTTNTGAKSNVLKSMELADSEFVMFLGDDDRIRKDCLPEIISILNSSHELGVLVDTSKFRYKDMLKPGYQDYTTFYENLYWYMGNAGFFICRTDFIKLNLNKYGYDFFNECWPQTQLMILGLTESGLKPFIRDLVIPVESKHDEVMVYTSYYLWRTCVYDLLISIEDIKNLIPAPVYDACRKQMKFGIKQNFLNILQCGIFVDDTELREKTKSDINKKSVIFSAKEKSFLNIIVFAFSLPLFLSRIISNCFIGLTKGAKGLKKKNDFVSGELHKKSNLKSSGKQIRSLEFEK